MGIIIKRPDRVHDLNPNYITRWSSNREPYIFYIKRIDLNVQVQNLNGYCLLIPADPITYGLQDPQSANLPPVSNVVLSTGITLCTAIGGDIWNVNTYTGRVTIVLANGNMQTDIPFVFGMSSVGAYINWNEYKQAHKTWLKITGYLPSIQNTEVIAEISGSGDKTGAVRFDIRTLLEHRMENVNKCTFTSITQLEYSGWLYFTINYKETYTEFGTFYDLPYSVAELENWNGTNLPLRYYAVNGSKYLLSKYGQNYADYEPQRVAGIYAKFLTNFVNPVYFVGYPFSLTYIRSKTIVDYVYTREEDELDLNGLILNHNDTSITGKIPIGLHQLTLKGNYTNNVTQVDVWLESGALASNNYVEDDYVQNNYTTETTGGTAPVFRITEKKRVLINRECRKNPIYLMWKNILGGWDFWLFDKVNETNFTAKQTGTYTVNVDNIDRQTYREKIISANQSKKYLLGDTVKAEQVEALAQIELSPQVYMLWDSTKLTTDPVVAWLGVNVVPKGVKYTSREADIDFEVQIELPEQYNISN
jgi:hypothetical protein